MNKIEKQEMIDVLRKDFGAISGAVLADFRGLPVGKVTALRASLRKSGIHYRVVKNTLAKQASAGASTESVANFFKGPTSIAYTNGDPVVLAKALTEYASANEEQFKLKAGLIEGKVVSLNELKAIATLPSKEVLVAKLLYVLNSPLTGLVNVLSGPQRQLVTALSAVAKKKEEASN